MRDGKLLRYVALLSAVFGFGFFASAALSQPGWSPTKPLNSDAFTDSETDDYLSIAGGGGTFIAKWRKVGSGDFVSRSTANGNSWTQATMPGAGGASSYPLFVGTGQWAIFGQELTVIRSADDGVSWTTSTQMMGDLPSGTGHVISVKGNEDGLLLMAISVAPEDFSQSHRIDIFKSIDGGLRWTTEGTLPTTHSLALMEHSGGSNWVAFTRDAFTGGIRPEVILSDDDGATWTSHEGDYSNLGTVQSDHRGVLLSVSTNTPPYVGTSRTIEIYISTSCDNGKTWSGKSLIHSRTYTAPSGDTISRPFASTTAVLISPNRWTLLAVTGFGYVYGNTFAAVHTFSSTDGGVTWGNPIEVVSEMKRGWLDVARSSHGAVAAGGRVVFYWENQWQSFYPISINGQSLGSDSDLLYRTYDPPVPRAAASDWALFH